MIEESEGNISDMKKYRIEILMVLLSSLFLSLFFYLDSLIRFFIISFTFASIISFIIYVIEYFFFKTRIKNLKKYSVSFFMTLIVLSLSLIPQISTFEENFTDEDSISSLEKNVKYGVFISEPTEKDGLKTSTVYMVLVVKKQNIIPNKPLLFYLNFSNDEYKIVNFTVTDNFSSNIVYYPNNNSPNGTLVQRKASELPSPKWLGNINNQIEKLIINITWASKKAIIKPNKFNIICSINNSIVLEDVFKDKTNIFTNETILGLKPDQIFDKIKELEC